MRTAYPTRIYLTGFMGSGKSTVGPILANVLGYDFVDLDQEIESVAGKSIPEIFSERGESGFRELESEVLRKHGASENVVVALGGGALTIEENLLFALRTGLVVYLRLSGQSLRRRLKRTRTRPLLRDAEGRLLEPEVLDKKIGEMLEQRRPFYEQAQLIVDLDDDSVGLTVDLVARAVRNYADGTPEKSSGC